MISTRFMVRPVFIDMRTHTSETNWHEWELKQTQDSLELGMTVPYQNDSRNMQKLSFHYTGNKIRASVIFDLLRPDRFGSNSPSTALVECRAKAKTYDLTETASESGTTFSMVFTANSNEAKKFVEFLDQYVLFDRAHYELKDSPEKLKVKNLILKFLQLPTLEDELAQLKAENIKLKTENIKLKAQITAAAALPATEVKQAKENKQYNSAPNSFTTFQPAPKLAASASQPPATMKRRGSF